MGVQGSGMSISCTADPNCRLVCVIDGMTASCAATPLAQANQLPLLLLVVMDLALNMMDARTNYHTN